MNEIEIRKWFDIIQENNLVEIRVFQSKFKTLSGYFKDADTLIEAIRPYSDSAIYFTLNEVNEACYSRTQSNKLILNPSVTTGDKDITKRRWLLIDIDPQRPSDTNSTDNEKSISLSMARAVYLYLEKQGFSYPIVCDSANGYHLLYKIDCYETTEVRDTIKNFLNILSSIFINNTSHVDVSVFNPSRICKLYGTYSRKGNNTKDRPQRISKILTIPDEIKTTSMALITKFVDKNKPQVEYKTAKNNYQPFDVDGFINRHLSVHSDTNYNGIRKVVLKECPFDSNHKAPDAAILIFPNGGFSFNCFHNSCSHYRWQDVRDKFEPKAIDTYNTRDYNIGKKLQELPKISIKEDDFDNMFKPISQIKRVDTSSLVRVKTGIDKIDERIIGCILGEVSLWSGNNGSGKSTLLGQLCINASKDGFIPTIFSGELRDFRIKQWIYLQAAGRLHTKKSPYGNAYYITEQVEQQIDSWIDNNLYVYNNDFGNDYRRIISGMQYQIDKRRSNVFVLDNLMAMDISSLGTDKNDRQTKVILDIVNFAKKNNVHIHIVAHPRKSYGFLRKIDISGSADLTNAVDNVFLVHRVNNDFRKYASDFFSPEVASRYYEFSNVIEVAKNRDIGVEDYLVGTYFEPESKRFLNYPYEYIDYGWKPTQGIMEFNSGINDFDLPE